MKMVFNLNPGKYIWNRKASGKEIINVIMSLLMYSYFTWAGYNYVVLKLTTLPYLAWWEVFVGIMALSSIISLFTYRHSSGEIEVRQRD